MLPSPTLGEEAGNIAHTSSQSSSGNFSLGCLRWIPAQFSRISGLIPWLVKAGIMPLTASRFDSSATWIHASRPMRLTISSLVDVLDASLYYMLVQLYYIVSRMMVYLDQHNISTSFGESEGHCFSNAPSPARYDGGLPAQREERGDSCCHCRYA